MAEDLYCGFCGKSQNEVDRLVAGAAANICNECAELAVDVSREEIRAGEGERGVACPGCGERIGMIAAVGRDQRWGITLHPGPTGLIQAATVAGTIDGAQKMMRLSCREDGANVQTYVERLETLKDGSIDICLITLATSKKWAKANARGAQGIEARQGGDAEGGSVHESPAPEGVRP